MSKYYDAAAVIQVIGCSLLNPTLLEDDGQYFYNENDFANEFHRTVFGAINNLYQMGTKNVRIQDIENYLSTREQAKNIYNASQGSKWLAETMENADLSNFDYYYNRMKKMTLFRGYESCGLDMRFLYDPDEIFDEKKKRRQEDYVDSLSLEEIAELIDKRIEDVKSSVIDNATDDSVRLGDRIDDILTQLAEEPMVGSPLYGKYINTLHKGARLGTYYIRSAPTNVGKSRTMVADTCYIACDEIYDSSQQKWVANGLKQPALYITTEQTLPEITTMCLCFLADVDEEHIKENKCSFEEKERVQYAAELIKRCPLYVEEMPDFTMKSVENTIKRNIRNFSTQYIFFDYIQSSVSILGEIARISGGTKLREDNVLFLLSAKLKDIATKFNVFVMTSTQVNASYLSSEEPDQNVLRGAKSIADRADWGSILLNVTQEDIEALAPVLKQGGYKQPNIKLSIYKNRGGKYNRMYLWMFADKATCRYDGMFATTYQYEPIALADTNIVVEKEG